MSGRQLLLEDITQGFGTHLAADDGGELPFHIDSRDFSCASLSLTHSVMACVSVLTIIETTKYNPQSLITIHTSR